MSDHLDRLLEGGQGNRESVNAIMAENQAAWAALNAPCPHEQGHHYLGDCGALMDLTPATRTQPARNGAFLFACGTNDHRNDWPFVDA